MVGRAAAQDKHLIEDKWLPSATTMHFKRHTDCINMANIKQYDYQQLLFATVT
jgi:hypothetical protein